MTCAKTKDEIRFFTGATNNADNGFVPLKDKENPVVTPVPTCVKVPGEGELVYRATYGKNKIELFCRNSRYHWRSFLGEKIQLRSAEEFPTEQMAKKDISDCFK